MIAFRNWWRRDEPGDDGLRGRRAAAVGDPNTDYLLAGDPPWACAASATASPSGPVARTAAWRTCSWTRRRAGQAWGAALVEAAFERARERGCARMELDANEANGAAVALYRSLGFESWSDPPGGNNLLMRRRL